MADKLIGKIAQVNSTFARNPGGYGRIMRKHAGMYRVDSSAYPGQEVTGWYSKNELIVLDTSTEWHYPQRTDGLVTPFVVLQQEAA